jgi:hypothetical protein
MAPRLDLGLARRGAAGSLQNKPAKVGFSRLGAAPRHARRRPGLLLLFDLLGWGGRDKTLDASSAFLTTSIRSVETQQRADPGFNAAKGRPHCIDLLWANHAVLTG